VEVHRQMISVISILSPTIRLQLGFVLHCSVQRIVIGLHTFTLIFASTANHADFYHFKIVVLVFLAHIESFWLFLLIFLLWYHAVDIALEVL